MEVKRFVIRCALSLGAEKLTCLKLTWPGIRNQVDTLLKKHYEENIIGSFGVQL